MMMDGERDDGTVWRLVTDHPDVFEKHVVPKLNGNDVKFFTTSIESKGDKTVG